MAKDSNKQKHSSGLFAQGLTLVGFLLLYVPLVFLVISSFIRQPSFSGEDLIWTFDWYRKLADNRIVLNACQLSLVIAFWSTVGSVLIGTTGALALSRAQFAGKKIFESFIYLPLIMPEIVLGLSLLIWFVLLRISLGAVSIILAHITFSVSYVILTVKARLQGFDQALEEAARDLGASPWQTFWKVTFPLISPGILSGALMAFILSFDDFLITFFTAGVGSDTLPLKIYSMIKFGVTPEINALSTLIIGASFLVVLFFFKPLKRVQS